MDYRFNGKAKTLALGVYPAVSLAKARQRRDKARELLADNIDPGLAKRAEQHPCDGMGLDRSRKGNAHHPGAGHEAKAP
ncbi:hypothetical protein GmRootV59_60850 (plasmid) [Variovorax sp. V59]